MSDATLTKAQGLLLLRELATNEAFRLRYEEKPAAALTEIGVPHETIVNLPAACLASCKLAGAAEMEAALKELQADAVGRYLTMHPPQAKI
ncbi:NHLP-related RiPP peptide [Dokdonella sp.]|jgi:putative modified peptide|uniref:NHLP-related RiPP peptide n=1 Tax=Dokdonella sp. TaxID=2291710 RepID=UPI002F3F3FD6